jgi:hypothetical protein
MFRLKNNDDLLFFNKNFSKSPHIENNIIKKSNRYSKNINIKYPLLNIIPNQKINIKKFQSSSQPKLFSLIDIDDKKTNSKGPTIPNTKKRYIEKELNKLLHTKKIKIKEEINIDSKENFKNEKSYLNKTQIIPKSNDLMNKYSLSKSKSQDELKILNSEKQKYIETIASRKKRLYKPNLWDNSDEKINKNQRDKWMPKGFELFENIINKAVKNNIKNLSIEEKNSNGKIKYIPIRYKYRQNMSESDIFHQKPKVNYDNGLMKKNKKYYQNSDIFHLKNDIENIKKSGEKSYFKEYDNRFKYTSARESHSEWDPKILKPNLMNHSSTQYNILNPSQKNNSKTKNEIQNECNKINPNECFTNKQKSLCEFIDLSRVSAPNVNYNYIRIMKINPRACYKRNNFCSEYYDIYGQYKNICDKTFSKQ